MLVDDHHLAVGHHVVDIALEDPMGLHGRLQVVQQVQVARRVEAVVLVEQPHPDELPLDEGVAALRELHLAVLLVDDEVAFLLRRRLDPLSGNLPLQPERQPVGLLVELRALLGGPGDDQGRARLVDQDRVHLVDDGVVQVPLKLVLEGERHVVAQVVEAELVVGAVDDVRLVGGALLRRILPGLNHPHLKAEGLVDGPHPGGVAAGQVVVDRDDVHAAAAEGVQVGGQGGDQGLAFAGAHLGDAALVQGDAADELHVEVAHVLGAPGGLAHRGERFGQQVLQALAVSVTLAQ